MYWARAYHTDYKRASRLAHALYLRLFLSPSTFVIALCSPPSCSRLPPPPPKKKIALLIFPHHLLHTFPNYRASLALPCSYCLGVDTEPAQLGLDVSSSQFILLASQTKSGSRWRGYGGWRWLLGSVAVASATTTRPRSLRRVSDRKSQARGDDQPSGDCWYFLHSQINL